MVYTCGRWAPVDDLSVIAGSSTTERSLLSFGSECRSVMRQRPWTTPQRDRPRLWQTLKREKKEIALYLVDFLLFFAFINTNFTDLFNGIIIIILLIVNTSCTVKQNRKRHSKLYYALFLLDNK